MIWDTSLADPGCIVFHISFCFIPLSLSLDEERIQNEMRVTKNTKEVIGKKINYDYTFPLLELHVLLRELQKLAV